MGPAIETTVTVADAAAMGAEAPEGSAATTRATGGVSGATDTLEATEVSLPAGPISLVPALGAGASSSGPQLAAEELEVVLGRPLLRGPLQDDAVPLPRVLLQACQSLEEAEAAFR